MRPRVKKVPLILLYISSIIGVATIGSMLLGSGCQMSTKAIQNQSPVGKVLPQIQGETLSGSATQLPGKFAGEPAVLLIGYLQSSQFDIDRWTYGLIATETPAKIAEVPAIPGLVPSLFSGWIDDGMRSGIPEEDWPAVITAYGSSGQRLANFTGTTGGRNARVLLLDKDGVVRWFWDQGFSAARLLELQKTAQALAAPNQ